ncbi:MAG: DNA-3-methyladenine glycosylase I [Opitutaceae bacterium]
MDTIADDRTRCRWAGDDPLYRSYHDEEWGVPVRDDRLLFEFLILEGAQAGLSWITVLRKRAHYRKVYDGFDPEKIARWSPARQERLLQDPGIIRNRLKVASAVGNARAVLQLRERGVTLTDFLWDFVEGAPIQNRWASMKSVPATTDESDRMSRELKRLGFRFVGSTICYAFMQAVGMVNDHTIDCFRHGELGPPEAS